MHHAVLLLD